MLVVYRDSVALARCDRDKSITGTADKSDADFPDYEIRPFPLKRGVSAAVCLPGSVVKIIYIVECTIIGVEVAVLDE